MKPRLLFLAPLALIAGCDAVPDDAPVAVSLIGPPPAIADANRGPLPETSARLMSAVAQGLVRFDAAGQIEPGLAIRWDVSDDGLYYTFRIDRDAIDAEQAARALRRAVAAASRNPLKPVLGAIAEIVAVTPEVIEIRLIGPRPDLLPLFAQPELAILTRGRGTGPLRIAERQGGALLLSPVDPATADLPPEELRRHQIWLRAEPASRAVARFAAGRAAIVLGGRFTDLPVARAATPPADALRFDPASGLLGLAVATRGGFVGISDNRRALSMAIDRQRIADIFGGGWRPSSSLLPGPLVELRRPATPDWIDAPLDLRRIRARETIAGWREGGGEPPVVRVAMPEGPGARMLFALLAADWRAIGVGAERVAADAPADLALVDEVAPGESAPWYLRRFECVRSIACSLAADLALGEARTAATMPERATRLADADARLAEISAFIPIAQPLRWSLVSRRLRAFTENRRATHPLDELRAN